MKCKLLPFLLLIHCSAFSQIAVTGSVQHIFAGSAHEYGGISDGNGGELTVDLHLNKTYFIGLGASAIKFDQLDNLYVPVFLDLKYAIPGKFSPFIELQPGYGFFNGPQIEFTDDNGNMVGTANEKGGIYFAGGVGNWFSLSKKLNLLVGLRYHLFKTSYDVPESLGADIHQTKGAFSVSVGITVW
jgi:hypothetical protein